MCLKRPSCLASHFKASALAVIFTFFAADLGQLFFSVDALAEGGFLSIIKSRKNAEVAPKGKNEGKNGGKPDGKIEKKKAKKKVVVQEPEAEDAESEDTETVVERVPIAAETAGDRGAGGKSAKAEIILKSENTCLVVKFDSTAGEVLSCTEALPLAYERQNCQSGVAEERGDAKALVNCEEGSVYTLRFRTQSLDVESKLRIVRLPDGRSGWVTKYLLDSSKMSEHTKVKKEPETSKNTEKSGETAQPLGLSELPAADVKPLDGSTPKEAPASVKYSGFMWIEGEQRRRFGYNVGWWPQQPIANFDSTTPNTHTLLSAFSNLTLELEKDRSALVTILEIGEIVFGNPSSGGAQGARSPTAIELRNFYFRHDFNDRFGMKGGIITTSGDTRNFVFSDHVASLQATYKSFLSEGTLWFTPAAKSLPGAFVYQRDIYAGINGTLGFLNFIKGSGYLIARSAAGVSLAYDPTGGTSYQTVSGDYQSLWYGGTFDYDGFNPVGAQATAIGCTSKFSSVETSDTASGYLLNGKFSYLLKKFDLNLSLEGLMTSGAADSVDSVSGLAIAGKRKYFSSPVNAGYFLTIATSDGVDDAPGTPTQSIIAPLNQAEGLRLIALSASKEIAKDATLLVKYGFIGAGSTPTGRGSTIGHEIDLQSVYQLSPSTSFQADYAVFFPGLFYASHDLADLVALKMKMTF